MKGSSKNIILKPVRSFFFKKHKKKPQTQKTFLKTKHPLFHSAISVTVFPCTHSRPFIALTYQTLSTALGNHVSASHRSTLHLPGRGTQPAGQEASPRTLGAPHISAALGRLEAPQLNCLQLQHHVSQDGALIFPSLLSPGPHDGAQPSGGTVGKVISSSSLSNDPFKNLCSCTWLPVKLRGLRAL